ncbi:hypothetical protein BSL78_26993 [Apostichopus japonicus]|uniref:Uncharacterized protein n=1 Tax=Stichopus japonicus TaxID=307972 RepID=A0A2G8JKD2_STIJA|nr:hypothetical protein BSL78_26993 [Apostichopus japonicus]
MEVLFSEFSTLGFVDPTAAQSSQARRKAAGGANVSNDLGIVSPDRTHREPYLPNIIDTDCVEPLMVTGFHDPYISNQRSLVHDSKGNVSSSSGSDPYLLKAGSTPGSDFNRTCDPYVSSGNDAPARKPNPERPGDANVCDGSNLRGSKGMMTMASKPYISKEKCIPGSKGENVDKTYHPYNSNGRDSTGWKPSPRSQTDPYVPDRSDSTGGSLDPYLPHMLASDTDPLIPDPKKEKKDTTFDPYISHSASAAGQNSSPSFNVSEATSKPFEAAHGGQYISSHSTGVGNTGCLAESGKDQVISDPYVTQASLESKIKNLDVPNELPPNNGRHGSTTHAPAMPANPAILEDMTEAPVDPYVAHAEAVRGSNDTATTGSKPSPSHRTVDKSDGSTVLQQENDPYTSHASLIAGSEFGNKPVSVLHMRDDPYISHDALSTGSEFGNKPVSVLHPRDDPYISHDALSTGSMFKNEPKAPLDQNHDPYISHDALSTGSEFGNKPVPVLHPRDDPYISHDALSAGLNKPSTPLQQRNDPYVSHDALLSGSVIKNEPKAHLDQNHDPYISQDALSAGPEIGNKPKTLLHQRNDSTVSHDALSAASDLGHEPRDPLQQRNDPYVSCDVLSAGLEFQSKLKPPLHENDDPYVCHDVHKAGSEFESKPESCLQQKDDPYVSHDALLTGSVFENKRRTPLQPKHDPYVSHDDIFAGSGGQTKNQKTPL